MVVISAEIEIQASPEAVRTVVSTQLDDNFTKMLTKHPLVYELFAIQAMVKMDIHTFGARNQAT